MTATKSYPKPEAREPGGFAKPSRHSLHFRSALGALGAATLLGGCAGELDKDPNSFTAAYGVTTTGGATGTGGSATGGTGMGGTVGTGGTTSTGGSATGGAAVIPPDDPCVAMVLAANSCTTCHSGTATTANLLGAGLSLEGTDLGKRLSMTTATYKGATNAAACVQGALIIDPNMPANSILLKKVAGTQVCGDKMPQGTGLSGDNLKCFTDWINKF